MSGEIPSLTLYKGKSWTEWTNVLVNSNNLLGMVETETNPTERLLPRKEIYVYGTCPKMDVKVLCHCEKCGKVIMPQAFFENHQKVKHGPEQPIVTTTQTTASKKKNSQSKNKKKSTHLPPPPSLFPKTPTPPPTTTVQTTVELSPPVLQPIQTPLPPPSPSNSRHKKSKKSSKKAAEFDHDKHSAIYDDNKSLRSVGSTNHMIKKSVTGKKETVASQIDQKTPKEQETKNLANLPKISESTATSTTQSPVHRSITATFVKSSPAPSSVATTAKVNDLPPAISQALQVSISSCTTTSITTQGNMSPSSVVYMPMSPVAVVGPVQFVQLGGPLLRVASTQPLLSPPLATQPIVVTIPVSNSTPVYSPHPKPISMSTSSARRIGGSLLLQNQRLGMQRNEIQMAAERRGLNSTCSVMNTHPHRPNILKNSAKNNMKINSLKRSATDKLSNDTKQIRISADSLNGFILHTEVNEASEAPQNNNSVHEKITLLNMK